MSVEPKRQFECVIPILNVSDFQASMKYYIEKLGFTNAWEWGQPPTFGCVKRDGIEIFFCLRGQGQPGTWHSIFVNDVDALYEELKQRGAKIVMPLKDEPWGVREFHVEDPNGHTFRLSQGKG
jgi:predicted enzyme related to lactoylglutathione lyase